MLLSPLPVGPRVFIRYGRVAGVGLPFFVSGESGFASDSILVSRRCSLTSALFCISYDFGSDFLKLWKRCCRNKKKKTV